MTVSLSVYSGATREASGYLLFRVDGDDLDGQGPRFVGVHRLVAYAHGDLDSLGDDLDVHHVDGCPVHNGPENLSPEDKETHGRLTRQQAAERGRSA